MSIRLLRTYSELIHIPTFEERFEYLSLKGRVGEDTFGFNRYLNQAFYHSEEWSYTKHRIIVRDLGCDLGILGREIQGRITIHHINPITKEDILDGNHCVLDPENLICVSHNTHMAIHYGDSELLIKDPIQRRPNDTCPWR